MAALVAVCAIPLVDGLIRFLPVLAQPSANMQGGSGLLWEELRFGLPTSAVAMTFVGLPLVFLLKSRRSLTVFPVLLAGVFAGALAETVFLGWLLSVAFHPHLPASGMLGWAYALMGAGYGLVAGVLFCAVAGIPWRFARL